LKNIKNNLSSKKNLIIEFNEFNQVANFYDSFFRHSLLLISIEAQQSGILLDGVANWDVKFEAIY